MDVLLHSLIECSWV